jgi:hypothetical protein
MKDEKKIFFEREYEAFPESGHRKKMPPLHGGQRRLDGAQDERGRESDLPERMALQQPFEVFDVQRDVRKLGHRMEE